WGEAGPPPSGQRAEDRSLPSEYLERDGVGGDRPGQENGERGKEGEQPPPLQHRGAQRIVGGGQRQGADQRLKRPGEPLRREKDAGQQPHGNQDRIDEPVDPFEGLDTRATQKPESREGETSEDAQEDESRRVAPDRHAKDENPERDDGGGLDRQKDEARKHMGKQIVG